MAAATVHSVCSELWTPSHYDRQSTRIHRYETGVEDTVSGSLWQAPVHTTNGPLWGQTCRGTASVQVSEVEIDPRPSLKNLHRLSMTGHDECESWERWGYEYGMDSHDGPVWNDPLNPVEVAKQMNGGRLPEFITNVDDCEESWAPTWFEEVREEEARNPDCLFEGDDNTFYTETLPIRTNKPASKTSAPFTYKRNNSRTGELLRDAAGLNGQRKPVHHFGYQDTHKEQW